MHIQQKMNRDLTGPLINLIPGRETRTVLAELNRTIDPYLFFWDEWIVHEDCNLVSSEVHFIAQQSAVAFNPRIQGMLMSRQALSDARMLKYKLDVFFPVFKNAVILEFLFLAIRISRKHPEVFFDGPIAMLDLSKEMKSCLGAFETGTIRQIFFRYSRECLCRPWMFEKIKRFYLTAKAQGYLTYNLGAYETDMR